MNRRNKPLKAPQQSTIQSKGQTMQVWYRDYWAQTWYKNSYLVNHPNQIARGMNRDREWNNLDDCGCNFTCLAMIMGIDPARLASILADQKFFRADRAVKAKFVTGKTGCLVWDLNQPFGRRQSISIHGVWHSRFNRRVNITVQFQQQFRCADLKTADGFIKESRSKRHHIICGPEWHSNLVAGAIGRSFYVWDPDETRWSAEQNLGGKVTIQKILQLCESTPLEFLTYSVRFSPEK